MKKISEKTQNWANNIAKGVKNQLTEEQLKVANYIEKRMKKELGHIAHIQSIQFNGGETNARVACDQRVYTVNLASDGGFNYEAVAFAAGRQFSRRSFNTELCKLLRIKNEDGSKRYTTTLTKKEILDGIKFVKNFAHQAGQMIVIEIFGKKVQFKEFCDEGFHFKNEKYVNAQIRQALITHVFAA